MAKRHLPVLKTPEEPDGPPRPAWQWVGFGAIAIFAAWVPLSAIAGATATGVLGHARGPSALGTAVVLANGFYGLALVLGALAGGYLVGRWGPADVGVRHAGLAGLAAAALLALVMSFTFGPSLGLVPVGVLAPLAAALGGRLGLRARVRRA